MKMDGINARIELNFRNRINWLLWTKPKCIVINVIYIPLQTDWSGDTLLWRNYTFFYVIIMLYTQEKCSKQYFHYKMPQFFLSEPQNILAAIAYFVLYFYVVIFCGEEECFFFADFNQKKWNVNSKKLLRHFWECKQPLTAISCVEFWI